MKNFASEYGVARHIYLPLIIAGGANFAVGADWTPAAGDVKISKDGGTAANVTNLPSAIAMGNAAEWDFSLTATELTCSQAIVTISDSATKAVADDAFVVELTGEGNGLVDRIHLVDPIMKRDWAQITGEASRSLLNAFRRLRNTVYYVGSAITVRKEDTVTEAWNGVLTAAGGDPVTAMTPTDDFFTNFPLVETPLSQGGIWYEGKTDAVEWNDMHVTANGAMGTFDIVSLTIPDRYRDNIAFIKPSYRAFHPNQFAQGVCYRAPGYNGNGGSHEIELTLRGSSSGASQWQMYEVLFGISGAGDGYYAFIRWDGTVSNYTPLYDSGVLSPGPQDGDVFRVEIIGNLLSAYRNTVLLHTSDITSIGTTYSTGQPGVGTWPADGGQHDNAGWKSFRAGDLS